MQWHEVWKVPFWLTGLNVLHPALFFPVSAAWWYVTLALQWVLVAPLVQRLHRATGLVATACIFGAVQFAALAAISLLPDRWSYLSQGLIVARAAEVGFGLVLAHLLSAPQTWKERRALILAAFVLVAVAWLSVSVGGVTAPLRLLSYLVLALAFAQLTSHARSGLWLSAAAAATYPFYLVHAPIQKYVQVVAAQFDFSSLPVLMLVSLCLALGGAALLSGATHLAQRRIKTTWLP